MTDEQINEAITEVTGLWDHPYSNDTKRMYDFCNDLNAMHEAEKVLLSDSGPGVWECYRNKLRCKYGEDDIHATARQRAEAFLRTIGKWEDAE